MNRKLCVSLSVLALFCLIASSAFAGVIMDVRALPSAGVIVSPDGKTITVDPSTPVGTVINLALVATVSGSDTTLDNDGIQTMFSGIEAEVLSSAVEGKFTGYAYTSPFTTLSDPVAIMDNLIGNKSPVASSGGGYLEPRAASMQFNSTGAAEYQLLTVTYEITAINSDAGPTLSFQWQYPVAALSTMAFKIDGVQKNGLAAGQEFVTQGEPITTMYIPEPSVLILLGMGALALLAYRRRK
jgi:hypothetical protein